METYYKKAQTLAKKDIEQMKEREDEFYKTQKPNTLNNKTYKKKFDISYGYPEFAEDHPKSNTDNENNFVKINSNDQKDAQNAINQTDRKYKKGNTLTQKKTSFFSNPFSLFRKSNKNLV
jgi:hypothetical protein